jgi:hypothetical protein
VIIVAHEERLRSSTYVAGADLSAKQYTMVKMNTSGQVIAIAAATDLPLGILQNKPTSGQSATVAVAGVSKLVCSAAVTASNPIGPSNDGRGAPTQATGVAIIGQARTATANANEIFSVEFSTEGVPALHA